MSPSKCGNIWKQIDHCMYNQILEILNITFKLVFKEYLTPNVLQITLINQVPYMGTCS